MSAGETKKETYCNGLPAALVLDAIMDSSYDGLFVMDGKGNPVQVNKAFERITGIKADTLLNRDIDELIKEGIFSRSACREALQRKETVTIRSRLQNGRVAIITARPFFNRSDEIDFVVANVRDITELNLIRQQLEKCDDGTDDDPDKTQKVRVYTLEGEKGWYAEFIARSRRMKVLYDRVCKVSQFDTTVLLHGESGVGKKLLAKMIHKMSSRKEMPFVEINCAALPEQLLETELFGYEKGAFTGASSQGKRGLLEVANGGTILLDEICGMPPSLQIKLLSVLDEMRFKRIGGVKELMLDVRLIVASNAEPKELIQKGILREDLVYRLGIFPIRVPALRERKKDIPELIDFCLKKLNLKYKLDKRLSPGAASILQDYDYPGNVRELRNIVERIVIETEGVEIGEESIPPEVISLHALPQQEDGQADITGGAARLKERIETLEEQIVLEAVNTYGSTHKAAKVLGVSQSTVVRKIKKYKEAPDSYLHQ